MSNMTVHEITYTVVAKNRILHTIATAAALMLAMAAAVAVSSCRRVDPVNPGKDVTDDLIDAGATAMEDVCHEKLRDEPYPKQNNGLFLNPPTLIVPQQMKTMPRLEFVLSMDPDCMLDHPTTIHSDAEPWCMFNPHTRLQGGTWYWRFRSVSQDLNRTGKWSETYSFEIKEDLEIYETPAFSKILYNTPSSHPRLFCFLDSKLEKARESAPSHREYKEMLSRAANATKYDWSDISTAYKDASTLSKHFLYLTTAWYLTGEKQYLSTMASLNARMLERVPSDKEYFADNFTATDIAYCYAYAYDLLYDSLTPQQRIGNEQQILRCLRRYYPNQVGSEENHIFDNHFWQQNLRVLFQCAYLLFDKSDYRDEILPMYRYYYELWAARAPASGYNRDGMWHNGTYYFKANMTTLVYMPLLLSHLGESDFLQHPWYRNAGRAIAFSTPPSSESCGFGDGFEKMDPDRQRAAFADVMARELGDSYAAWYAGQCWSTLATDYSMRLYRMCATKDYDVSFPTDVPHMTFYKDVGEADIHTNLQSREADLAVAFRSSQYGSGSHTSASQNAFNILYGGKPAFRSSGYYTAFSDAHNLMSYRHSRAHNTILVNGIGQPYSTRAFGNILRAMGGDHISYCLGDASKAYCGVCDDPMWVEALEAAGIAQTPANGFGPTPLTKYRRHIAVLHDIGCIVIYDELEASEKARWDWLLHSPVSFKLTQERGWTGNFSAADKDIHLCQASTSNTENSISTLVTLLSRSQMTLSQTDKFAVAPTPASQYPNQWHMSATIKDEPATRILAIIEVGHSSSDLKWIKAEGQDLKIGNWTISAELDPAKEARLSITDDGSGAILSLGSDQPLPKGVQGRRTYRGSTLLYDSDHSTYMKITEQTDSPAPTTKSDL